MKKLYMMLDIEWLLLALGVIVCLFIWGNYESVSGINETWMFIKSNFHILFIAVTVIFHYVGVYCWKDSEKIKILKLCLGQYPEIKIGKAEKQLDGILLPMFAKLIFGTKFITNWLYFASKKNRNLQEVMSKKNLKAIAVQRDRHVLYLLAVEIILFILIFNIRCCILLNIFASFFFSVRILMILLNSLGDLFFHKSDMQVIILKRDRPQVINLNRNLLLSFVGWFQIRIGFVVLNIFDSDRSCLPCCNNRTDWTYFIRMFHVLFQEEINSKYVAPLYSVVAAVFLSLCIAFFVASIPSLSDIYKKEK